jgi:hypothetical protein
MVYPSLETRSSCNPSNFCGIWIFLIYLRNKIRQARRILSFDQGAACVAPVCLTNALFSIERLFLLSTDSGTSPNKTVVSPVDFVGVSAAYASPSFLILNNILSKPRSAFGLRKTTIFISLPSSPFHAAPQRSWLISISAAKRSTAESKIAAAAGLMAASAKPNRNASASAAVPRPR